MASPTFLGDGNTPRRSDALWAIEQKILGALADGAGGGGVGGSFVVGANQPGAGVLNQYVVATVNGTNYAIPLFDVS